MNDIGYKKGKVSAPAQDKELREFALWHFNKGRESLMKEVIEVLEEGKGYDAWGHDNISGEWDGLMKRLAKLLEVKK
jgi:hypothetical protein